MIFMPFPIEFRKKKNVGWTTDGRTDGQTDQRTDRPSYRDARTHLTRPIRPTMRPHDEMIVR